MCVPTIISLAHMACEHQPPSDRATASRDAEMAEKRKKSYGASGLTESQVCGGGREGGIERERERAREAMRRQGFGRVRAIWDRSLT